MDLGWYFGTVTNNEKASRIVSYFADAKCVWKFLEIAKLCWYFGVAWYSSKSFTIRTTTRRSVENLNVKSQRLQKPKTAKKEIVISFIGCFWKISRSRFNSSKNNTWGLSQSVMRLTALSGRVGFTGCSCWHSEKSLRKMSSQILANPRQPSPTGEFLREFRKSHPTLYSGACDASWNCLLMELSWRTD